MHCEIEYSVAQSVHLIARFENGHRAAIVNALSVDAAITLASYPERDTTARTRDSGRQVRQAVTCRYRGTKSTSWRDRNPE